MHLWLEFRGLKSDVKLNKREFGPICDVGSPGLVEKTSDINPPLKSSIRTLHSWFGSEKPAKVSILSSQLKIAELNEVGNNTSWNKLWNPGPPWVVTASKLPFIGACVPKGVENEPSFIFQAPDPVLTTFAENQGNGAIAKWWFLVRSRRQGNSPIRSALR